MQMITLYRYTREDGGVTVSPVKPDCDYTEMYRLVADEGKVLIKEGLDGRFSCADTLTTEGWEEVDALESDEEGASEE